MRPRSSLSASCRWLRLELDGEWISFLLFYFVLSRDGRLRCVVCFAGAVDADAAAAGQKLSHVCTICMYVRVRILDGRRVPFIVYAGLLHAGVLDGDGGKIIGSGVVDPNIALQEEQEQE